MPCPSVLRSEREPPAVRVLRFPLPSDGEQEVAVGDEVVVFGDPARGVPSATDWADAADTINYEIVTRIGNRVPRRTA